MSRRKIYDREGWMSRASKKLGDPEGLKRDLLRLDADLLEMSERLSGKGIGSLDYTSQKKAIEETFVGMEVLRTYIEDVDEKFGEINEAFKRSVSKNAVEELSKIKMED